MVCKRFCVWISVMLYVWLPTVAAFIHLFNDGPVNANSPDSDSPQTIRPADDGSFLLPAAAAQLFGDVIVHNEERQSVENFKNPRDQAIWTLKDVEPGKYDVLVD